MEKKEISLSNADSIEELIELQDKDVEIRGATLVDSLCNYSYELLKGPTKGDVLNRKGAHIIHEDLQDKFSRMIVFFAHLDDAFTGNTNATPLEDLEQEPETDNYTVTSFAISGVEENRSLILKGFKQVNYGVINFATPKIKLDGNYLYTHELKTRLFELIHEVEQYMNGKTEPKYDNQTNMFEGFDEEDDAFENGKID